MCTLNRPHNIYEYFNRARNVFMDVLNKRNIQMEIDKTM
jgi:hypothetical protein